jgi:hypothetical protein
LSQIFDEWAQWSTEARALICIQNVSAGIASGRVRIVILVVIDDIFNILGLFSLSLRAVGRWAWWTGALRSEKWPDCGVYVQGFEGLVGEVGAWQVEALESVQGLNYSTYRGWIEVCWTQIQHSQIIYIVLVRAKEVNGIFFDDTIA